MGAKDRVWPGSWSALRRNERHDAFAMIVYAPPEPVPILENVLAYIVMVGEQSGDANSPSFWAEPADARQGN